jgi:hypothetical protein
MPSANLLTRQLRAAEANSLHLFQDVLTVYMLNCSTYSILGILLFLAGSESSPLLVLFLHYYLSPLQQALCRIKIDPKNSSCTLSSVACIEVWSL